MPDKKKKRTKIPSEREAAVLFESDNACCLCKTGKEEKLQIHHIDGNASNNDFNNLVALCLNHHDEITRKGGLAKSYSPVLIKKYRRQWYNKILAQRKTSASRPEGHISNNIHEALLDAIACHEIIKTDAVIDQYNPKKQIELLSALHLYASRFRYGHRVKQELISLLYGLSCDTRHSKSADVAYAINSLTSSALPIFSLVNPSRSTLTKQDEQLFHEAIEIGRGLIYDGIKYCKNIQIVSSGARILWDILRYAHLNDLIIKAKVLEVFDEMISVAQEYKFEDARKWLAFEKADALALDGDPLPELPRDIEKKIYGF